MLSFKHLWSIGLFLLLISFTGQAFAQSPPGENSFEPAKENNDRHARPAKPFYKKSYNLKLWNKYIDGKKKEYDALMKANAKRYKKMDRMMTKPQYSDFAYFGHKRKPKKRPVGKRRFCKECHIRH